MQIICKSGKKCTKSLRSLPCLLLNSAPPNSDWLLKGLRQRATGSGLPPGSNNKGWPPLRNVRGRIPLQWYQYQYKCQPNVFTHCWPMFWNATPTPIYCSTWNSSTKIDKNNSARSWGYSWKHLEALNAIYPKSMVKEMKLNEPNSSVISPTSPKTPETQRTPHPPPHFLPPKKLSPAAGTLDSSGSLLDQIAASFQRRPAKTKGQL